ncbi:hypothetical protein IGI04_030136, partial [Brassica rapa subsp. trilocularis]
VVVENISGRQRCDRYHLQLVKMSSASSAEGHLPPTVSGNEHRSGRKNKEGETRGEKSYHEFTEMTLPKQRREDKKQKQTRASAFPTSEPSSSSFSLLCSLLYRDLSIPVRFAFGSASGGSVRLCLCLSGVAGQNASLLVLESWCVRCWA